MCGVCRDSDPGPVEVLDNGKVRPDYPLLPSLWMTQATQQWMCTGTTITSSVHDDQQFWKVVCPVKGCSLYRAVLWIVWEEQLRGWFIPIQCWGWWGRAVRVVLQKSTAISTVLSRLSSRWFWSHQWIGQSKWMKTLHRLISDQWPMPSANLRSFKSESSEM